MGGRPVTRAGSTLLLLALLLGAGLADTGRPAEDSTTFLARATATITTAAKLTETDTIVMGGEPADGYITMRIELMTSAPPKLTDVTSAYRTALGAGGPASVDDGTPSVEVILEEVPATTADRARYRLSVSDGRRGVIALEIADAAGDGTAPPRAILRSCIWNDREPAVAEAACKAWIGES